VNRWIGLALLLLVGACSGVGAGDTDDAGAADDTTGAIAAEPTTSTTTSADPEDYPDAIVRELRRQMSAPRPVPNSALPPRHLDTERFPELLVDRTLIVSGGRPPAGIRSIDEPTWRPPAEIEWLEPEESVLVVEIDGVVHIYPTQILLWHEIVNDTIGDTPVTVTYCPLCNSAVAFDRRLDDQVLDFGTSGALLHSALVMYDRQTESLWSHFDGRSVVGDLMGAELDLIAVQTTSWAAATNRWPDALVLDRPTGDLGRRAYGTSPYPNYEMLDEPLPGFYQSEPAPRLAARARVVGLIVDAEVLAVDRTAVVEAGVLDVAVGAKMIRLEHSNKMRSPLDDRQVSAGVDIGSISAVTIEDDGERGAAVPVLDTFWFAWAAYFPDTELHLR